MRTKHITRIAGPGATALIGTGIQLSGYTNAALGLGLIGLAIAWAGWAVVLTVRERKRKHDPAVPQATSPIGTGWLDAPDRRKLREQSGLRTLTAFESGASGPIDAPPRTFFFIEGADVGWIWSYEDPGIWELFVGDPFASHATIRAAPTFISPVEIHKYDDDLSLAVVGFVLGAIAERLASGLNAGESLSFVLTTDRWDEHDRVIALPIDRHLDWQRARFRSYEHGYLYEVTLNADEAELGDLTDQP